MVINFVNPMRENHFEMITCNTASSIDIEESRYFPLNYICTMCDFINYGTYFICVWQSRKTPQMRGFVFSNYRSLNNWNLLLESGEFFKRKWHKTTKNGMLKLTYTKALWKYLSSIASTACHFRASKSYAPKI